MWSVCDQRVSLVRSPWPLCSGIGCPIIWIEYTRIAGHRQAINIIIPLIGAVVPYTRASTLNVLSALDNPEPIAGQLRDDFDLGARLGSANVGNPFFFGFVCWRVCVCRWTMTCKWFGVYLLQFWRTHIITSSEGAFRLREHRHWQRWCCDRQHPAYFCSQKCVLNC